MKHLRVEFLYSMAAIVVLGSGINIQAERQAAVSADEMELLKESKQALNKEGLFESDAGYEMVCRDECTTCTSTFAEWGTADAFGRKQLWYFDTSSVLRFGALTADGDATNASSEGAVFYGKNTLGNSLSNDNFAFARIKPLRFALHNSIDGTQVDIFRADDTGLKTRNDSNGVTWEVNRARGTSRTAAGATGSRPTAANVGEQWFDTTLGIPIWWDGSNWVSAAGVSV